MIDKIHQIDGLIRSGRGELARSKLENLTREKISRSFALSVASLARRAKLPELGVRILNAIVRPEKEVPSTATIGERAEYAVCLVKAGAIDEGMEILRRLDAQDYPQVSLFLGATLVAQWEYRTAISFFEKFIASPGVGAYQRLVGKTNLAAAFVVEKQFDQSLELLKTLRVETSMPDKKLLHGSVLQLSGQNALGMGDYKTAQKWLKMAAEVLSNTGDISELFVRKWMAILLAYKTKGKKEGLQAIAAVRKDAVRKQHWETIRDLDKFKAIFTRNELLIHHIYFGTPFESFRVKLLEAYGYKVSIPTDYLWKMGPLACSGPILNLLNGEVEKTPHALKVGQVVHRLVAVLTSDFYRPFRMAALFSKLFPNEYFNPRSGPLRVHQTLKRLRKWFEKAKLPLRIEEQDGAYRISTQSACGIRVSAEPILGVGAKMASLHLVKRSMSEADFSVQQVSELLKVSRNSALRIVDEARKEGCVRRLGRGPATRYRFVA